MERTGQKTIDHNMESSLESLALVTSLNKLHRNWISREDAVVGYHDESLNARLRDEHPVKWVIVMTG